ncbi:MAG: hypothetical protein PHG61_04235 [Candidatus Marinimicrobia bacterium]|nr:hypothetical protein [Candidatus Neomarinimicrobiota bacterium]
MIVPMKKLVVFVSSSARDSGLKKLRRLGVLHIKPTVAPVSEDLSQIEKQIARTDKALEIIGKDAGQPTGAFEATAAIKTVSEILDLSAERQKISGNLEILNERRRWYDTWGKISQNDLATLRKAGVHLRLYAIDKNQAKQLPKDKLIQVVAQDKSRLYLALIAESREEQIEFKEEIIPETDYDTTVHELEAAESRLNAIAERHKALASERDNLTALRTELEKRQRYASVRDGMGISEAVVYLEGYCPADSLPSVTELADKEGWGYLIDDPDDPEEVPTLIRKARWLKMIDPVFNFMGTIPGYQEFDISLWFLAFFSLFFAILVGDAGYGVLFLMLAIFFRRKYKNAPREPFWLVYVLSGALIIWGSITGTWFGFETVARLPLFSSLVIEQVATFSKDTAQVTRFMMFFTFLIGAIHLSIGHILNGLKKINSLQALAQVGWVGVVWGMFFLAGQLVLSKPMPGFALYILLGGAVIIACFDNYLKGHFWKGLGATIGNLPLSIISAFGDVVSYLRLFAVGMAGAVVEVSFNNMAIGDGVDNLLKGIIAVLIIIFGHGLNIVLCMMSVIVHGIRLNMLEFSGHLGMQWTGQKYEPFRE